MQASVALTVPAEDAARVLHAARPGGAILRSIAGEGKQTGFFSNDALSCVIVDAATAYQGAKAVERIVVALDRTALITFDVVAAGPKASWMLTGQPGNLLHKALPFSNGTSDQVFLNVIAAGELPNIMNISAIDLAGVQIGDRAILFYVDVRAGRSAVFFDAPQGQTLKILVAGLAPGIWEIWRNGWLDEPKAFVRPETQALYYETKPGGFFLRRAQ